MNHVVDDRGQVVIAAGAPGSVARVQCEHPALIARLNALRWGSMDYHAHAIDEAVQLIRDAGVRDEVLTATLLEASDYAAETDGSAMRIMLALTKKIT